MFVTGQPAIAFIIFSAFTQPDWARFSLLIFSDFAVKFGLNSLPTVVVISQSKKKFVNLVGMYDDKSISSFLDGVLSGKHGTSSFQDLPQVRSAAASSSLQFAVSV